MGVVKRPSCWLLLAACASVSIPASSLADDARDGTHEAPPERTGFQLALRTGYMVPFGQVDQSLSMGDAYSGQVPLMIDVGWKFIPQLFVGLYGGLGFGGTSGQVASECNQIQATCLTASLRLGIEAQYFFLPAEKVNPWVGYGIGLESTGFSATANGQSASLATAGWEFGHFMVGVDFRLSKDIGIGPLLDFSLGQYSHAGVQAPGQSQQNYSISDQALHEWLLIGGRVVFFP